MSDVEQSPPPEERIEIITEQSIDLEKILADLGGSLIISTYQAGKIIVARPESEQVNAHFVDARKPMGIAIHNERIAVGAEGDILFFENVADNCARLDPPGAYDACYVERYAHITGAIDIHEMAFGGDGQIWFINTKFSALCTIRGNSSFVPVWKPPFISRVAEEDRCHLNGLGMRDGQPRYVTALGESDVRMGWRENKAYGGVLMDIVERRTICRGLSMPHSPRWHAGQLWVCESGKGTLARVDPLTGALETVYEFPGFTRGLDFVGPFAFVGLSQIRETAIFGGIPIAERAAERNCGIWVIDLRNRTLVGALSFVQGVQEIFAVQFLAGRRYPELLRRDHPVALRTFYVPNDVLLDNSR